jgi:hypothetical protein
MYSAVVWSNDYKLNTWMIDVLYWIVAGAVSIYVQGLMA